MDYPPQASHDALCAAIAEALRIADSNGSDLVAARLEETLCIAKCPKEEAADDAILRSRKH